MHHSYLKRLETPGLRREQLWTIRLVKFPLEGRWPFDVKEEGRK